MDLKIENALDKNIKIATWMIGIKNGRYRSTIGASWYSGF